MAVTQIHTRKKPQQERSRKRVQKVLQAARDLISEKGLEATNHQRRGSAGERTHRLGLSILPQQNRHYFGTDLRIYDCDE